METSQIVALLGSTGAPAHSGYAPTGARVPYTVARPMTVVDGDLTLDGQATAHDFQFGVYCCGASVDASFNLALRVVGALQGKRVGDSTLACSVGYVGAQQESRYETQVTVQINQGALS